MSSPQVWSRMRRFNARFAPTCFPGSSAVPFADLVMFGTCSASPTTLREIDNRRVIRPLNSMGQMEHCPRICVKLSFRTCKPLADPYYGSHCIDSTLRLPGCRYCVAG